MQRQINITTAIKAYFSFEIKRVTYYHINKNYHSILAFMNVCVSVFLSVWVCKFYIYVFIFIRLIPEELWRNGARDHTAAE